MTRGSIMMLVGLTLIAVGVIGTIADSGTGSFVLVILGVVFTAVGARRRRRGE